MKLRKKKPGPFETALITLTQAVGDEINTFIGRPRSSVTMEEELAAARDARDLYLAEEMAAHQGEDEGLDSDAGDPGHSR